jgi:alginate O-acetyltransferase complex protein AlgI
MLFTELRFLPFFLLVLGVHWALRASAARKAWLLLASWAFYAAWDARFLALIGASTLLDWSVGLRLPGASARARGRWLLLSLTGNLGLLGFFKYFGFFVDSAVDLLAALGFQADRPALAIVLPVGISFYTFQTLSYTIDVYRGTLAPRRSLLDFALFVAFFPQLVAGPIVRAAEFLPELDRPRRWRGVDVRGALVLFLLGFFKKACISDNLAPLVERVFADPAAHDALSTWIGVLCYATQIYCDFSGYSDMAIACAALLGYTLPRNFAWPYLSAGLVEFWRRWHISLSSWLRDYLYISLGGNRLGRWRTYRNLMLTMLLGGLWHGAGWNFVVWGGLHGLGLCAQRALGARVMRIPRPLLVVATFAFVCLCWVFFRAQTFEQALTVLRGGLGLGAGTQTIDARLLGLLGLLGGAHLLAASGRARAWWRGGPGVVFAAGYGLAVALVLPFVSVDFTPFIYFQF